MWDFIVRLFYAIDWRIQALALGCIFIVAYVAVRLFFGETWANRILPALIAALVASGAATRLRQAGWRDRLAEEERALEMAKNVEDRIENEVHAMPDDKLDREIDRWSRK